MVKRGLYIILTVLFLGCSATHQLEPDASHVQISSTILELDQCKYLGEIIGSEGKLYNYLLISNYELTIGARNDLRNQAYVLGGNVVKVETRSLSYSTSTVYVGNVYHCPLN